MVRNNDGGSRCTVCLNAGLSGKDSQTLAVSSPSAEQLATCTQMLLAARRIVVLTGAGVSTDSGIPDFRGPNGLWTKDPQAEKMATLQHYLADPNVRARAWTNRLHSPAWHAEPNTGHLALVELERRHQLLALITQNVDELHQRAGNRAATVIEVHGTMRWSVCWRCGDRQPMSEILLRVEQGEADPGCVVCRDRGAHGILKSDTISFGQALIPEVIDRALAAAAACDLFLAVGTTLQVFPVANAVLRAHQAGAQVIIVNGEPTKMDHFADEVLRGSISEILPLIVAA